MGIVSIVMTVLGVLTILFGFLSGVKRGLFKASTRLIIIVLCAVVAFIIRVKATDIILNTPISEGKNILQLLTESMVSGDNAEAVQGLANVVTNILKMVLQILVFIILFFVLKIVSMIVYWIIAGIISSSQKQKVRESLKQENEKNDVADKYEFSKKHLRIEEKKVNKEVKRSRKGFLGGLVGIVQGVVIAACVLAPLSGLLTNVSSLMKTLSTLEIDGSKIMDAKTIKPLEDIGLFEYSDSTTCKVYSIIGDRVYKSVSQVKDDKGNVVDIKSQIEAIDGGAQMAGAVLDLSKVDLNNGFTSETKDELVNIFNNLDEIKDGMSEESVKELDKLIKDVMVPMLGEVQEELPIDLEKIDFAEVDFSKEGEVISSFYDLVDKTNNEQVNQDEVLEEVVTTLSDSNLILPILSQMSQNLKEEDKLNFSEEDKNKVKEILDNLENKENVEELKALFGIE